MTEHELTKTLDFDLHIESGDTNILDDATSKARTAYNQTLEQYFNTNKTYKTIREDLPNQINLIKNSVQLIADKTHQAIERYHDDDDYNCPRQRNKDYYPLRSNHGEGYKLTLENNNINFRISAIPHGDKLRGTLKGSDEHKSLVKQALEDDDWRVGTSEVVRQHNRWRLHVTVTHKNAEVTDPTDTRTLVGVDVNESNIALAALTEDDGVVDSIVLEYDEVKRKRHEYFTVRKRLQSNGKLGQVETIGSQEERFVTDALHKLTRRAVEWASQFENPCIVLEDLKHMRESIEYGSQMNRRLHSLPFGKIQNYITYKANFESIPVVKVDPEYTSQECLACGHTSRSNRQGGRFHCVECGFQDHSDRKAGVSIAEEGIGEIELDWIVPPLNRLPVVRTTEGCDGLASGGVEPPTTTQTIGTTV